MLAHVTETLAEFAAGQLRAELARHRISDAEAARRIGVDETWVRRRKSGARAITMDDLERIARALDKPAAFFMPEADRVAS